MLNWRRRLDSTESSDPQDCLPTQHGQVGSQARLPEPPPMQCTELKVKEAGLGASAMVPPHRPAGPPHPTKPPQTPRALFIFRTLSESELGAPPKPTLPSHSGEWAPSSSPWELDPSYSSTDTPALTGTRLQAGGRLPRARSSSLLLISRLITNLAWEARWKHRRLASSLEDLIRKSRWGPRHLSSVLDPQVR